MSMFMISPFKSLFCSGIKKTSYRNNFLDLDRRKEIKEENIYQGIKAPDVNVYDITF